MEKRNLIFIFILTMCLFGINQYFSNRSSTKSTPKSSVASHEETPSNHEMLRTKIAPLQNFALAEIFSDENGKEHLCSSINFGHSFLSTTTPNRELPKHAFAKKGNRLVEVTLTLQSDNGLVYYSTHPEEALMTTYMPQVGDITLQMLSLEPSAQVMVAEYQSGKLFFPVEPIDHNAIALYESDTGYIPVGYYSHANHSFELLSEISDLAPMLAYKPMIPPSIENAKEQFFVLENATQQIVFSTLGGAIAEINLPFESEKNTQSIVKEVGFDRIIEKNYTANSLFPLHTYSIVNQTGGVEKRSPQKGGYYPLLRRDLKTANGNNASNITPNFYAMSIVSEDEDLSKTPFKVTAFSHNHIQFESIGHRRKIRKTYSLPKDSEQAPYCLNATIEINGDARGLWVNSGLPEVELISKNFSPTLKYRWLKNGKTVVEKISLPKTSSLLSNISPYWVANTNGFFGIILDPLTEIKSGLQTNLVPGNLAPTRISLIDSDYDVYPKSKYPAYDILLPLKQRAHKVDFRVYAGPLEDRILKVVDATYTKESGSNPDYTAAQSFHGFFSFISEPFARFLFIIMNFFYSFTHSWGFSIILLTIVLRILMYPLNAWSFKSTARMQLLSPKLKTIQDKYKKDPKRLQMEMIKLYRENKVNPFSGCLPLLIQMPFLFGMLDLLKSTFGLRGASFIPGWINNLAAPDVVFSWSYPIFFIGNSFHLLPILLGVIMFVQQKIMTKSKGAELSEQQKQQQKMGTFMTIGFTFLFYHFPSGLNIYWISSSLLGILQQWYTNRVVATSGLKPKKVK